MLYQAFGEQRDDNSAPVMASGQQHITGLTYDVVAHLILHLKKEIFCMLLLFNKWEMQPLLHAENHPGTSLRGAVSLKCLSY